MRPCRVLLVTPPMVQFNAPYAATPWLTAYLRRHGVAAQQADLSLSLALRLFSPRGLDDVRRAMTSSRRRGPAARWFLDNARRCRRVVGPVMRFLQGRAPDLAGRIAATGYLPEGPRFRAIGEARAAGIEPSAEGPAAWSRFRASLFIDDLADAIREGVDPRFGLSRYAERLAATAPSFDPIDRALRAEPTLIDRLLDDLTLAALRRARPDLVGVTIPFPGNVYAAFRIARAARAFNPAIRTVAGGGYVSTELREVSDPRVFDFFDFLILDDGEQPLLRLVRHLQGRVPARSLPRTLRREDGRVVGAAAAAARPRPLRHRSRPVPCYDGLPLSRYPAIAESLNPMHRLWTERRWLKLQLAHGCYWHRCAFCDTKLDYIARFDPADAGTVVRWMARLAGRTGETNFHFVDEAAPPALLGQVARRILDRRLRAAWWANVRFEPAFTPALARLLGAAGCLAVTGGLECAEESLLRRMNKGISLPSAARAMHACARAGMLVHSYLMYGFPGQTAQQTLDALELVRQLFAARCLHSAYWHRFALSVHSPIYAEAAQFGVHAREPRRGGFARNEAAFADAGRADHAMLGRGLLRATFNYLHGVGLEEDPRAWFERRVPRPRLQSGAVAAWLRNA